MSSGVSATELRIFNGGDGAALYHLTDSLYRAESLDDIYEAAFTAICNALNCDRASILLFDQDGVMRFVAWRGLSDHYRTALEGHSPWRPGDTTPEPIYVCNIAATDESEDVKSTIVAEDICGLGFIPLTSRGRVIGKFMTYYRTPLRVSEQEDYLARTIARQLAYGIERHRAEEARRQAEEALRRNEERLRQIIDSATEYAIITLDKEGKIASWNSGAERILGYNEKEALGQDGAIFFTPEDRASGQPEREMRQAREHGRATDERWHIRKDGSRFWGSGAMLTVEGGGADALVKIFRDGTAERLAQERQEVLVGELNHRVKNILTSVQALAEQTLRTAATPELFATAFTSRLSALSHAHDLLTQEAWTGAKLEDIAQTVLQSWIEDGRATASGPSVRTGSSQALALSMAFHELMTNAMKHGALSVPEGHVSLSWNCNDACEIVWVERGGPAVTPPSTEGFGLRVLNRALARQLDGLVEVTFDPEGARCRIQLTKGFRLLD
jgi:PAS domain S-box-containing protein